MKVNGPANHMEMVGTGHSTSWDMNGMANHMKVIGLVHGHKVIHKVIQITWRWSVRASLTARAIQIYVRKVQVALKASDF